jgi:hypothetical protein
VETDELSLAVVMERKPLRSNWQPFQWLPAEVVLSPIPAGAPRCLRDDPSATLWLYPGLSTRLYSDEAEGYFLNLDSGAPCWFIMWRMEGELAVPQFVTLSYNEAARLMDGGEQVDTLPLPAPIVEKLGSFVAEFYRPEPKGKRRHPSFEGGAAVQQMARDEGGRRHGR